MSLLKSASDWLTAVEYATITSSTNLAYVLCLVCTRPHPVHINLVAAHVF